MAAVATPPSSVHHPHTGRYANIYQPPTSDRVPESAGDYFSSLPRKRQRGDSSVTGSHVRREHSWPQQQTPDRDDHGIMSTESLLANDRYRLKGGFDTPGLLANTDSDKFDDVLSRRNIQDRHPQAQHTESAFAGPLARERNGFSRGQSDATSSRSNHKSTPSWTRLAITLPFTFAGKVFSFGGAVLKGFYAGGGQGYEFDGDSTPPALRRQQSSFEPGTPIPGAWQDSPPLSQTNSKAFDETQSRPAPNKRRLTDRDAWVMVGTPDLEAATPPSPKRRISSNITPRLSRPSLGRAGSSRRSVLTIPRRHSHLASTGSPTHAAPRSPGRQARQSSPLHTNQDISAASPETEKLRRRQMKQERAADRTMNNMTRQLEELIRQGQEALGTKFVVEGGDHEDEGFVDET